MVHCDQVQLLERKSLCLEHGELCLEGSGPHPNVPYSMVCIALANMVARVASPDRKRRRIIPELPNAFAKQQEYLLLSDVRRKKRSIMETGRIASSGCERQQKQELRAR
nr:hypothetical protein CFP56_57838 [Quercus suber]